MAQFNKLAAKKILQTAKRDHNTTNQQNADQTTPLPSNEMILGKLLASSGANWSWQQVRRTSANAYETVTNGVSGTASERYAFELNGKAAKAGDVYWMRRTQVRQSDNTFKTSFTFTVGGAGGYLISIIGQTGPGKYRAWIVSKSNTSDIDPSTPLGASDLNLGSGEEVIALNLAELGTNTNVLMTGDTADVGVASGVYNADLFWVNANGKKVVTFTGYAFNLCDEEDPLPDDEDYSGV